VIIGPEYDIGLRKPRVLFSFPKWDGLREKLKYLG
jgi:hypothetical protein